MLQEGEGGLLVPPRENIGVQKTIRFPKISYSHYPLDENYSSYYLLVLCMQIYDFFRLKCGLHRSETHNQSVSHLLGSNY